ncbi:MAG: NADP-binding protein [Chloroflexi bacterium]|nr:NADP-binding protein [Chloroflexota bacterium]
MGIRVIQYGTGFIGQKAIQLMTRQGYEVVAAIDTKGEHVGKDIGELANLGKKVGVKVADNPGDVLKKVPADLVTMATVTKLEPLWPQLKPCLEAGLNVSSISEELAYPWLRYPELAGEIDALAKAKNVTVVGSGVNPGLVMDLIPLTVASSMWKVDKVSISRVVDFGVYSPTRGTRRFGVTAAEFRAGVLAKQIPLHTGLFECLTMISETLGWKLDSITETWESMISKSVRTTPWYTVQPGTTCGFRQTAVGSTNSETKITLDIFCVVQPNLEEDGVEVGDIATISGEQSITVKTVGGPTQRGDLVTTARMVNIIPAVIEAKPGLLAVKDLPAAPPRVN